MLARLEIEKPQTMPVLILYVLLGVPWQISVPIMLLGLCSAFQLRLKIGRPVFLSGRGQPQCREALPYLGQEGSEFPHEGFGNLVCALGSIQRTFGWSTMTGT